MKSRQTIRAGILRLESYCRRIEAKQGDYAAYMLLFHALEPERSPCATPSGHGHALDRLLDDVQRMAQSMHTHLGDGAPFNSALAGLRHAIMAALESLTVDA